ncbi:MAG: helix-turn-helix domain-containing protein [Hyphomonadaceae bacterium]|nr:helix-turn-helix domain-containing protein [Hyphomonadaceae bacterium]
MAKQDDLIRRWIKEILEETGLTASELAVQSQLAPSTLTRFLDPEGPTHSLRAKSIAAIAKHFGRALPIPSEAVQETAQLNFVEFMRRSPLVGVDIDLDERVPDAREDVF